MMSERNCAPPLAMYVRAFSLERRERRHDRGAQQSLGLALDCPRAQWRSPAHGYVPGIASPGLTRGRGVRRLFGCIALIAA